MAKRAEVASVEHHCSQALLNNISVVTDNGCWPKTILSISAPEKNATVHLSCEMIDNSGSPYEQKKILIYLFWASMFTLPEQLSPRMCNYVFCV